MANYKARPFSQEEWSLIGPELKRLEELRKHASDQQVRVQRIQQFLGLGNAAVDIETRSVIFEETPTEEQDDAN